MSDEETAENEHWAFGIVRGICLLILVFIIVIMALVLMSGCVQPGKLLPSPEIR